MDCALSSMRMCQAKVFVRIAFCVAMMETMASAFSTVVPVNCRSSTISYVQPHTKFCGSFRASVPPLRAVWADAGGDAGDGGEAAGVSNPPKVKSAKSAPDTISWFIQNQFPRIELQTTMSNAKYVRLPARYLEGSGIGNEGEDLLLYRRQEFEDQFQFIEQSIIEKGCTGYTIGPEGCGKSATGFAYAVSLDRSEWDIIWIQLSRDLPPTCIMFRGDKKFQAICSYEQVKSFLKTSLQNSTKQFLMIDGLAVDLTAHREIEADAKFWKGKNAKNRCLNFIASIDFRVKNPLAVHTGPTHVVYSWCSEDYQAAVEFDAFREYVGPKLDALPTTDSLADALNAKFWVAGGSVRFMFSYSTADAKESIREAIRALGLE